MTFLYEVQHVITAWSSVVGAGRQRCSYNYNRTQIERHVVLTCSMQEGQAS